MNLLGKNNFSRVIMIFLGCLLLPSMFLTSCRDQKAQDLQTYQSNMASFFESVTTLNQSINEIDSSQKDSAVTLLSLLDELNAEFEKLRGYEIPEEFSSLTDITADAADSMSKAVTLYHAAYDSEYNAAAEADAYAYYERANKCVRVILQVLNGDTPAVEGVTYQ